MNPETTAVDKTEWPEWAWTTDEHDLPSGLYWREGGYPPIGSYCELNRDGKFLTGCRATHYFHVAGNLYLIVRVESLLEKLKLVPGDSMIVCYDEDLMLLVDEDDDPTYPLEVPPTFDERAAPFRVARRTRDEKRNEGEEDDLPF